MGCVGFIVLLVLAVALFFGLDSGIAIGIALATILICMKEESQMDNTEYRNEHFMFCKNVIGAMMEAMNDLLTMDDDVVARAVQSRKASRALLSLHEVCLLTLMRNKFSSDETFSQGTVPRDSTLSRYSSFRTRASPEAKPQPVPRFSACFISLQANVTQSGIS